MFDSPPILDDLARQRLRQLAARYPTSGPPTSGPRYTSYPTAVDFGPLGPDDYEQRLALARARSDEPWSAYVHVPFCAKRCNFCACSVVSTPEHERVAAPYVARLIDEIELVGHRLGARRQLAQLHLGGGTPNYLSAELLARIFAAITRQFVDDPARGREWSIELDARTTTPEHIELLAEFGIDRVSLGVQDLDPEVQRAIGRIQSFDRIRQVVRDCRAAGVRSVNLDLIHGLPGQTLASMHRTLDGVLALAPDRLAVYGYAHVPWLPGRGNQRAIDPRALPDAGARIELFLAVRERLLDVGYQAIGMDHFAWPDDPLAQAERAGTLRRNFMGYTVSTGTDLLGFGVTAIGEIAGAYVQNHAKLSHWQYAIERGELATARGIVRTPEDQLRAAVIEDLMCHHGVERERIAERFGIDFDRHFARELAELAQAEFDGLIVDCPEGLELTEVGRLFVRNVAMVFDERLRARAAAVLRLSATV